MREKRQDFPCLLLLCNISAGRRG
ncbi:MULTISPECIES: hypothetical protein [Enterobacteriaceae]|nr:hypothetical protein [Leclercia adecarboxylata]MBZ3807255.1 hypothetical protein [Leclercia adecarboxylata]MCE6966326.1 hypothetical protein [Enterobacter sp. MW07]QXB24207.1 hypothetical protein I6L76_23495 [Lelliottia amnigena]